MSEMLNQLFIIKYKYPKEKYYVYIYSDEICIANINSHTGYFIRHNNLIKRIVLWNVAIYYIDYLILNIKIKHYGFISINIIIKKVFILVNIINQLLLILGRVLNL
jgi:hypothetical protein